MRKNLTFKQKSFCKKVVETKNPTEAAFQTYNVGSRNMAEVIACRNMKNVAINREIERIMEDNQITDDYMVKTLKEGMEANVVASYKGEAEQTNIPDHNIRHKYWESAAKIKQYFPGQNVDNRTLNIDIELENMDKKKLSELLGEMLNSLKETNGEKYITGGK
jgi:phage terminase small subunit